MSENFGIMYQLRFDDNKILMTIECAKQLSKFENIRLHFNGSVHEKQPVMRHRSHRQPDSWL